MPRISSQLEMEQRFEEMCRFVRCDFPGTINEMLSPQPVRCDYDKKSFVIAYETENWMKNPGGIVHGGIIATMLDNAMGTMARTWTGALVNPTISMDVSYSRPIQAGCRMEAEVTLTHSGRTIAYVTSRIYPAGEPDKVAATASGAYFLLYEKRS